MKRGILLSSLVVLLAVLAYAADGKEQAADKSAQQWLALTDSGKYSESWDAAAAGFRAQITRSQWQDALQKARAPLGAVDSRKLSSAKYTRELPGAPDGEYVVLQYSTVFANKKNSVETLTMTLDASGEWKAAGYFIR